MIAVLALARPDSWDFPLFLHVLGAAVMVGGLLAATSSIAFAKGDARLLRMGYWTLLAVSLPGYVVMRIGAEWLYSRGPWDDLPDELVPRWLEIGYIVADAGALVLLAALVVGGMGVYRLREGKGAGLLKVTMILSILLLAAYVVAAWAMAGKPD